MTPMAEGSTGRSEAAFTMAELIVVLIIVSLVAAASIPMFLTSARQARVAEAEFGLNAIMREALRYKTETGGYLEVEAGDIANSPDAASPGLGLDFSDDRYFDNACYSVRLDGTYGFVARCDGGAAGNAAPGAQAVGEIVLELRGDDRLKRVSYDGGSSWSDWN
jgi:type II secretory pathway pseudopilin PulG